MTNAELVKIAKETLEKKFDERFAKKGHSEVLYKVVVEKAEYNGARCYVLETYDKIHYNRYLEPLEVYAIAGKDNIVEKLHAWFDACID